MDRLDYIISVQLTKMINFYAFFHIIHNVVGARQILYQQYVVEGNYIYIYIKKREYRKKESKSLNWWQTFNGMVPTTIKGMVNAQEYSQEEINPINPNILNGQKNEKLILMQYKLTIKVTVESDSFGLFISKVQLLSLANIIIARCIHTKM